MACSRCLKSRVLPSPFLVIASLSLILGFPLTAAEELIPVHDLTLTLENSANRGEDAPVPRSMLLPYESENTYLRYLEWLVKDPINLATRPTYWTGSEWSKFGVGAGVVGALLPADKEVRDVVQRNRNSTVTSILDPIRDYYTGGTLELAGVGLFVGGMVLRNEKLTDSGFLAAESVFYALQVSEFLKRVTQRERPHSAHNQYEFNGPGGTTSDSSSAFVSGEVIGAFAFASSISAVWERWWVTWPLYIAAGAVAMHRVDHDAHWLTDVTGGALLGHAIGSGFTRLHYGRKGDGTVAPFLTSDTVGVQLSFRF